MRIQEAEGTSVSLNYLPLVYPTFFFMRFPVAWVLSVSVAIKGVGISDGKDFWENTTRRRGDFCGKQEACPCPRFKSRKYLCHRNRKDH